MKRIFSLCLLCIGLCLFSGCSTPNTLQMDLFQGYGEHLKLLHMNASSKEKEERMRAFSAAIENAQPLEKDASMFAYYPDFLLEISPWKDGKNLSVIVDINGEFVDFMYPGPYPEKSSTIYRSSLTSREFKALVHQG